MSGGDRVAIVDTVPRLRARPRSATRPRPTWERSELLSHDTIGSRYHRFTLRAPSIAATALPGQFVMITVEDGDGGNLPLPRPMAIHRRRPDSGAIEIVFDVAGRGTELLARLAPGAQMTVVGPLGQSFPEDDADDGPVLLLGRGIGVCGVMTIAEHAAHLGAPVVAVFSGRDRQNLIGADDAAELGIEAFVVDDASGSSHPDAVRALLEARFAAETPAALAVCGSRRLGVLAEQLGRAWGAPVRVSVEAHMACGLGYCHGCALPGDPGGDREGPLVCVDGPVFDLVSGESGIPFS